MAKKVSKDKGQLRWIPVEDLHGIDGNPQVLSAKQSDALRASIARDGFVAPALVRPIRGGGYEIVSGNHRVMAAQEAGMSSVPVIVKRISDRAARRIAINMNTIHGDPSATLLAPFMAELESEDLRDLYLPDDLAASLKKLDPQLLGRDEDDVPEPAMAPVSKPGDLWVLGTHRLLCGDSTKPSDVARVLGSVTPHLMVTDPPYGVNYDPSWRKTAGFGSKGSAIGKVMNDSRADWRQAYALFPGSVAYVWHGGLHAATVAESLKACKFEIRAQIVWVKTRPALSRGHYHWQHEPAVYVVKQGETDDRWGRFDQEHELAGYAVKDGGTASWSGGRKQSSVWFIEHLKSDTGHGTQKPVECMRRPIENNSSRGQAVYEPFSGSGTTIIAAETTGRACLAIELSPLYVDVAVRRWQLFTGEQAVLDGDGRSFEEIRSARADRRPSRRAESRKTKADA